MEGIGKEEESMVNHIDYKWTKITRMQPIGFGCPYCWRKGSKRKYITYMTKGKLSVHISHIHGKTYLKEFKKNEVR